MQKTGLYYRELIGLRKELLSLKNCQITFLTFSVTATGVLLGVATSIGRMSPVFELIFLFPLIVLVPSWWIFFDKATTITRVVGYYRILEDLVLERYSADQFVGWENALREFRKRHAASQLGPPANDDPHSWIRRLYHTIALRTGHKYWIISFSTFAALSALCVSMSIQAARSCFALAIALTALVLFLASFAWNVRLVWLFICGRHSYDSNEKYWKAILGVTQPRTHT